VQRELAECDDELVKSLMEEWCQSRVLTGQPAHYMLHVRNFDLLLVNSDHDETCSQLDSESNTMMEDSEHMIEGTESESVVEEIQRYMSMCVLVPLSGMHVLLTNMYLATVAHTVCDIKNKSILLIFSLIVYLR